MSDSASIVNVYGSASIGNVYGSASIRASGQAVVRVDACASVLLFGFAVAFVSKSVKGLVKKSKTATVIKAVRDITSKTWLEDHCVEPSKGKVILFKRVSSDFKTQEKTANETLWTIGATLTHPNWEPALQECGGGKFHACHNPKACDRYRQTEGDKYIAIEVAVKDLYAWPKKPEHANKIAFRKGKVLHEVNAFGEKV